ncbi:TPA: hypothetical protein EYO57_35030, partial [Candidatus Poribacteria bacterium]|nr:hypothetical protein [Candidatus Poribacteria bacterium]
MLMVIRLNEKPSIYQWTKEQSKLLLSIMVMVLIVPSPLLTAGKTAGQAKISVVTSNGKFASITIELLELVLSVSKSTLELAGSAAVQTGELASVLVTLKDDNGLPIADREVTLVVDPADNLKMNPSNVTDQDGKAIFSLISTQPGMRVITASVGEVKLDANVAVIFSGDIVAMPVTMGIDPNRIKWEKDGSEMVLIPAGSFEMGDHFNEGSDSERPVHTVELDRFYMDVNQVTVGQFRRFVQESGYQYDGNWDEINTYSPTDEHPMVSVNWNDAVAYCNWAGKRLPTEAEWEYAARGGLVGQRYAWGEDKPDGSHCNFADKNADLDWADMKVNDGYQYSAPVGSYPANGYGLYDMAGNVWEWCSDWYDENYY